MSLTVVWFSVLAGPSVSARAEWISSGPFGGSADIVRVVPRVPGLVLLGTANGLLYRSRNGGASWTRLPFPAQFAGTLHALAVDPRQSGTWYAGMESENAAIAGLYKTDDAGATWRQLEGPKGRSVWSLALWTADPKWIAAGTGDGIFLSGDGGATWRRISPESNHELRPVVSLAFDPADRRILYAGTLHLPWRTRNSGGDWESIHSGMIDDSDVFSMAAEPGSRESVFASACSGVYHSGNGGVSWTRLATPRGAYRAYLVMPDPAHPEVLFAATSAGLLRSPNRGTTWTNVTPQVVHGIAFDPVDHEKIFLASSTGGLLISRDGGRTVTGFNTGFVNRNFTAVAASGPALYAASIYEPGSGGIFRSMSRGLRWERVAGPEGENILRLAAAPDNAKLLFAAGYHGLFRSTDGGDTWKPVVAPGVGPLKALAAVAGGRLLAGTAQGLFASTRNTWTAVALPRRGGIDGLQLSPGGVVAAIGPTGAFRSEGSNSWIACGQPGTDAVWYGLAFDSAGDGIALAATARGLFRSTDGCASWQAVRGGLEADTTTAVVFHPERRGEAFAAQSGRIFGTADGGLTWTRFAGDGPADAYPDCLFFLSGAPERLFALFPRLGVLSHSFDRTGGTLPAGTSPITFRGAY